MTTTFKTRTLFESPAKVPPTAASKANMAPAQATSGQEQLLFALGNAGVGVECEAAQARTQDWYRSSGCDWARALR